MRVASTADDRGLGRSGSAGEAGAPDRVFMRRALELARRGYGRVAPNPLVGAVVARDGERVGEGWHAEFGEEHAETGALRSAGERARGGTLYVTLEPCRHAGKTPPCTRAILEAGIRRVVIGCADPDPSAGGGAEMLRAEGVRVESGLLGEEAARQNASFLWSHVRERPFVTLKLALSLDGRIAARPGVRTRITGTETGEFVHRLRAGHDAILVGRTTACVDDPLLTARGDVRPRRPAVRIVLDSGLSLPPDARLLRTTTEAPVWIFCAPDAPANRRSELESAGARIRDLPRAEGGGLGPAALTEALHAEGIQSLMVEGGGRIAGSFLRAGRIERMCLAYAPIVLGPPGVEAFAGFEPADADEPAAGDEPGEDERATEGRRVPDAVREWQLRERRALGRDTLLVLESPELAATLAEQHGCSRG